MGANKLWSIPSFSALRKKEMAAYGIAANMQKSKHEMQAFTTHGDFTLLVSVSGPTVQCRNTQPHFYWAKAPVEAEKESVVG